MPTGQVKSELEQGSNLIEGILHKLPDELLGIIPESVWVGLTLDQKKDVLRQNNLLEKYSSESQPVLESETIENPSEVRANVVVERVPESKVERNPEFAGVLSEIQKNEEKVKKNLSQEDLNRIESEKLTSQSSGKSSWGAKVFGYSISDDVIQGSEEVSKTGDLEDGRTWASTLIRKMLAVFG